jgi:MoaA/NifB/PqqE/SkfB family radical SAM enzyme
VIVVWQVTERCNFACPFCAFDRTLERHRAGANPAAIREFGLHLARYQQETGESVLVSWLGGEPLRWAPLEEISNYYSTELGLRIAATTNGSTLGSPAVRRHLRENYSELTISVDAPGEAHDELRGATGLYVALSKNVRALADECNAHGSALRLRTNVVLMRQTVGQFTELCTALAEWGIVEISFNQLGGNDRPEFYPGHRLQSEDVAKLEATLPPLRAELARRGVKLLGSAGYLRRMNASARNERMPVHDCRPGDTFLFIDVSGKIAPCSFTGDTCGVPLEEVRSVRDLLRLTGRFSSSIATRRPAACDDCLSTRVFEKFALQTL